jgi:hypothetical protein
MRSAYPTPDAPIARALAEALETVATVAVSDAVIGRALRDAGYATVPERGPAVNDFAEGPLRRAIAERLGDDVSDEVLDQLRPVLARAASRVTLQPVPAVEHQVAGTPLPTPSFAPLYAQDDRSAQGAQDEEREEDSGVYASARPLTDPAPRGPLPVVFLASQDALASAGLAQALGGRATVRVVDGLMELLDALEEDADARRVLIVDGGYPSIQLPSLVTVAPELDSRLRVVTWRIFDGDEDAMSDAALQRDGWARCTDRSVEALAAVCARALD